jgi:hypothetical protein
MSAPAGGLLVATLAALGLLALLACWTGAASLDTLSIDLRHRWIAATAGQMQPQVGALTAPSGRGSQRRVGANVFLEQEVEPAKRARSLDLLKQAGITMIRQQVPWEQIEPVAKGQYVDPKFGGSTWEKFDQIVSLANERGMAVILRLDTSPRWALPADAFDGLGPPVHDEDYWDFVQSVAERYRGRVLAYQVWNEPNLYIEWGRQPPNASAYARLLSGAAQRIRAADPDALVLLAALSPTLTENDQAQNELIYLQGLYDAGARGDFDVLAVQAYGLRGGPDDPRIDRSDVTFSRPLLVRQVMEHNGDAATPVWATEMGWDAPPANLAPQSFGRVTPVLQARYTVRGFERVREQWPWMGSMAVWFWKRPDSREANQDWYWFRLADPEFALQPVYYALRDASVRPFGP